MQVYMYVCIKIVYVCVHVCIYVPCDVIICLNFLRASGCTWRFDIYLLNQNPRGMEYIQNIIYDTKCLET